MSEQITRVVVCGKDVLNISQSTQVSILEYVDDSTLSQLFESLNGPPESGSFSLALRKELVEYYNSCKKSEVVRFGYNFNYNAIRKMVSTWKGCNASAIGGISDHTTEEQGCDILRISVFKETVDDPDNCLRLEKVYKTYYNISLSPIRITKQTIDELKKDIAGYDERMSNPQRGLFGFFPL